MTTIEFLYLGVGIVAAIVGVICWHLADLDKQFDELKAHILKHDKYFTDVEWKRVDDLSKLADANQRIQALEERLYALEETSGTYFKSQL